MNRRSPHRRRTGWFAAALAAVCLVTVGACGFEVQTLQPYTPADGVNVQLGDGSGPTIKVRNVFILANREQKSGFLSASMVIDNGTDSLRSITGTALKADGSDNGSLTIGTFTPVALSTGQLVVLIDRAPITVAGDGLVPGVNARLVLTFGEAGPVTVVVPVLSSTDPVYTGVTPSASPSASPSA